MLYIHRRSYLDANDGEMLHSVCIQTTINRNVAGEGEHILRRIWAGLGPLAFATMQHNRKHSVQTNVRKANHTVERVVAVTHGSLCTDVPGQQKTEDVYSFRKITELFYDDTLPPQEP